MFTKLIFSVSRLSFGTLFSNSYLFPYFECVYPCFTHEQENLKNFKLTKLQCCTFIEPYIIENPQTRALRKSERHN